METSCTNCGAVYTYRSEKHVPSFIDCVCRSKVVFQEKTK